ncbi:MAG: hypothetical protein UT05_C0008G0031 [Parcubacteria group bacterium GW2011_GWF2_38_76]|nr:MAG: hypothetical protein UT05_C0008G0031 [Parcubacteria group bacterium GW2011_GWF2_38_76]HBM45712.1 hypothetical protein [Patescibacteria group bacterium]
MIKKKYYIPNTDFLSDRNWLESFLKLDISLFEKELRTRGEGFWQNLGEEKALRIFHSAATRVPAYKDFLKKRKINHKNIKTIDDFKKIPLTDKKNYISIYPLAKRCWDGNLSNSKLMAVSSGTSGEPTFWPRSDYQEYEQNIIHELTYKYSFQVDKYKTLIIIGFPMGIYVSGMATTLPTFASLSKKIKATFVTPGNNKLEVLKIVKNLWGDFEQFVFIGHPFFLKDVIETGKTDGLKWSSKKIKMMFCSEGFTEAWRSYVLKEAGANNKFEHAINTYGSSEILLTATETPLSIFIRKEMEKNEIFRKKIINSEVTPNIFQFNPLLRFIESIDNELLFTSAGQVPLVRFNIHDAGGIIPFNDVEKELGTKLNKLKNKSNINLWELPFVTLFGRSDHTVIFYAANIYPEHVRMALEHEQFFGKITGKFAMQKTCKENLEQCLEINIELKPGIDPDASFADVVRDVVSKRLKEINKEYADTSSHTEKDLRPVIKLWPHGHEKYFKPGLKPRFIVRE